MAENSNIEWTNHTVNLWWGCEKISPGCANCYASDTARRVGDDIWGKHKPRRHIKSAISEIQKLNRKARYAGRVDRVFMQSMSDLFEDDYGQPIIDQKGNRLHWQYRLHVESIIPESMASNRTGCPPITLTDLRELAFRTIDQCTNLHFLLLTKRPENIRRFWPQVGLPDAGVPGTLGRHIRFDNIWIGTSVENQEQADIRVPELLKCRDLSPVLFLSCEPLLGPVFLSDLEREEEDGEGFDWLSGDDINWVIAGGESGPKARPMHPDWARSLRDQCDAAGVPFFFKQWGEWWPCSQGCGDEDDDDLFSGEFHGIDDFVADCLCIEGTERMVKIGKKKAGNILDGDQIQEFPAPKVQP